MPYPADLPKKLRDLLFGTPFGEVWPPRPPVPAATQQVDGRTVALEILKEYVCALTFYCPTEPGCPPRPFKILPDNFHIEGPEGGTLLKFPSCVVLGSRADYDAIGLCGYVEEETVDQYASGTVVQWQAEYQETINLELWASEEPALRSMLAGVETAISPTEQMSGLRFRMPRYFNELVCFELNRRENYNDSDAARNRRRAQVEILMRFNTVALVNVSTLQPIITVATGFDPDTNIPLDLSTPTTIPPTAPNAPAPQLPGTEYVVPEDAADAPRLRYP